MEKTTWSGDRGFILAAAGAAVGFGNLWSFPRRAAESGGAVFIGIYLLLAALLGLPLLLAELALGRETASSPRDAFRALGGSALGGVLGELASLFMLGFYSVLGGCCLRYALTNLTGALRGGGEILFLRYISNVPLSAGCTVLFLGLTCAVSMAGLRQGVERLARLAVPILLLMLPPLALCALSLPGAADRFWTALTPPTGLTVRDIGAIAAAAGVQMFFSLSLGQGVMLTFGAYLPGAARLPLCAAAVAAVDSLAALLALCAVLPAAAGGGPAASALFAAMQTVFEGSGAWGCMFGFLFYLLVLLAALTSAVAMLEVVACLAGPGASRRSAAAFAAALSAIPAVAIARDGMGFGALPEIFGMDWLTAAETLSEGVLMPLATLALSLALRGERGQRLLVRQLGLRAGTWVHAVVRWCVPPLSALVMAARLLAAP